STSNEIAVSAYSWGGTGGAVSGGGGGQQIVGRPSLQDFQLILSPNTAEPGVWGVLARGFSFEHVTVHARKANTASSFEYLTYKLRNARVSSFQTASPGGVQDVIPLSFDRIEEDFTPQKPDGTAGTPVTVTYDVPTQTGGASAVAAE